MKISIILSLSLIMVFSSFGISDAYAEIEVEFVPRYGENMGYIWITVSGITDGYYEIHTTSPNTDEEDHYTKTTNNDPSYNLMGYFSELKDAGIYDIVVTSGNDTTIYENMEFDFSPPTEEQSTPIPTITQLLIDDTWYLQINGTGYYNYYKVQSIIVYEDDPNGELAANKIRLHGTDGHFSELISMKEFTKSGYLTIVLSEPTGSFDITNPDTFRYSVGTTYYREYFSIDKDNLKMSNNYKERSIEQRLIEINESINQAENSLYSIDTENYTTQSNNKVQFYLDKIEKLQTMKIKLESNN